MIDSGKKIVKVFYIYYLIQALHNNRTKINIINLNCIQKLSLKVWKTIVRAQKIVNFALKIFEIVIAYFQVEDKVSRPRFF